MQELTTLTNFLGWCSVINIALLSYAMVMITLFRGPVKRIHQKMFSINDADLDASYFNYLANYKIAILIFNLVPYVALKLMS